MNIDGYHVQVLVAISKECRPNSPKPDRAWVRVKPLYGIPAFGNALATLHNEGLLQRRGYRVKPSILGYALIAQWKERRVALRKRPILYGPEIPYGEYTDV